MDRFHFFAKRPAELTSVLLPALFLSLTITSLLSPTDGSLVLAAAPSTEAANDESRPPATADQKNPLTRAKGLIASHQEDEAISILKSFIASSSQPQSLAQAYLLMAEALNGKQEFPEAISYLERLLNEFPQSDLTLSAQLLLGHAYTKVGEPNQALSLLAEVRNQAPDPDTKRAALALIGEAQASKKDYVRTVQAWLEEMALSPEEKRGETRERIRDLIQNQTDKKTLLHLRDAYATTFPGDLILIRLIELHTNRGEDHLAERNLRLFLTHFPNHEYAPTATEQLKGFKEKVKGSQYVLAALLPTSGRLSPFGAEALNGIRLALDKGKESLGLASVGLVVKDSQTIEKSSFRSELADLIAEYHPLAVVGPLLSRELQAAASVAEDENTPFVTPAATLSDVRRLGAYLFSTTLTYQQQATRLADYAVTRMGYRRFCILHPESHYGLELARLFSQEVKQRGGVIIAVESYKESDTDFGAQIKRLKAEDLKHEGTAETTQTSKGAPRIIYQPGFDAVFLPGSYAQVALIAPQLLFHDVKVPFLGSSGWSNQELLRLADRSVEGSVFVDGFFPDSPDPVMHDFVERYRRRFQSTPSLFAAQAYDATRLVLEAIKRGASSGRGIRDVLLKQQDLPTLGGPTAFGPTGTLERRAILVQVKHGKFVQLD
jgi:ABC-type branched-subunit amino acid transport system substrate-binding protein/predicted negative regulator of RcsB-dependent stress response